MNPIKVSHAIENALVNYLSTTFNPNRDGQEPELAEALRRSFEVRGTLFKGPYLEITPPYVKGKSIVDLCEEGIFSSNILDLPCFHQNPSLPISVHQPLYAHQELAIRKLSEAAENVVISSGTGSGKTESFLLPILNDLVNDDTPGVRALLIYPMNALVNDQLERLRKILKGTPYKFGRYTSELLQKEADAVRYLGYDSFEENEIVSREAIRNGHVPHILVTNYAMLEYLLLRPEDAPIFTHNGVRHGTWRFVVLDEAHTYTGAQGIEVSLLLRRLRHRLGLEQGEMQCIATSATLIDRDVEQAADFARALFGEEFTADNIILGETDPHFVSDTIELYDSSEADYLHDELEDALHAIRMNKTNAEEVAIYLTNDCKILPLEDLPEPRDHTVESFLWETLKGNPEITKLRKWMLEQNKAVRVEDAASHIFLNRYETLEECLQALYHIIELGSLARLSKDHPPLLPARYHIFGRSVNGAWACLNPTCKGRESGENARWSRLFSIKHHECDACGCKVFPISMCRTCGQVYVRMYEKDRAELFPETSQSDPNPPQQLYFTWSPIKHDKALGGEADDEFSEEMIQQETGETGKFTQATRTICLRCGYYGTHCKCEEQDDKVHIDLELVQEIQKGKKKGTRTIAVNEMKQCARCYDKAYGRDREIATDINLGSNNPLSVVLHELYRQLPGSIDEAIQEKPGGGRKLLTFSDSRQGAARFAAYLQDIINREHYQHIIVDAIKEWEDEKDYLPDFYDFSRYITTLAWEKYQIFQHDKFVLSMGINPGSHRLRRNEEERLIGMIDRELMAQFTVRQHRRQSLEGLGLVAVKYFDREQEPDFSQLASQIGMDQEQAHVLVEYLLDDLRRQKIISLPDTIKPDDEVFGRHRISPRLVLSKPQKYEVPWIGATSQHQRFRFVRKMLQYVKGTVHDQDVHDTLLAIWLWLLEKPNELMDGNASVGYQLSYKSLLFESRDVQWYQCQHCRRFHYRGNSLPCSHPECLGILESVKIEDLTSTNFFVDVFNRPIVPIRIEEHTAQLDSNKGQDYQEKFKKGDINVLSCSTTFEMGIDLGDLQSVVMNNVPPTVANYRQRAGRAGRRASGTAFILTWASSDKSHDLSYFNNPIDIISGEVRVPQLAIQNEFIRQRHINAVILSEFMRYRLNYQNRQDLSKVGEFFDEATVDGSHYDALKLYLKTHQHDLEQHLRNFSSYLGENFNENWIAEFEKSIDNACENYKTVAGYYQHELNGIADLVKQGKATLLTGEELMTFQKLLDRLKSDSLISYLSSLNILPNYAFPLDTVELTLRHNSAIDSQLRLQRDLRQAIREYAPGAEVVADKMIWESTGIEFHRKTPLLRNYGICPNCSHVEIGKKYGIPITTETCKVCGTSLREAAWYVKPDGFYSDRPGEPAGQYVQFLKNLMRTGIISPPPEDEQSQGELVFYGYDRQGEILFVNEGSSGFRFCMSCGKVLNSKQTKCKRLRCQGSTVKDKLSLGHTIVTDTLHLRFESTSHVHVPPPENTSFWLSLMYALLQGASRALQIERRDIDAVLDSYTVTKGWQQTIVIYDNVPGGAGHVKRIQENLRTVITEALRVINCVDCAPETSCYHCLRDFNNQIYHSELKRGEVMNFLEALEASLSEVESEVEGASHVVASDLPRWLIQKCNQANDKLLIAANVITQQAPQGEAKNWLDIIYDLLTRDVEVHLALTDIPEATVDDIESLSLLEHLRILLSKGLYLHHITTLPEWNIIIDPSLYERRAIRLNDETVVLNGEVGGSGMLTTIHMMAVTDLTQDWDEVSGKLLQPEADVVQLPSNTRVVNLEPRYGETYTEESLFQKYDLLRLFDKPVREITVNDRYLIDYERIFSRLGSYIELANHQHSVKSVRVFANRAGQGYTGGTANEQDRAFVKLRTKFPQIDFETKFARSEHDRSIMFEYVDGTKSRLLMGRGLDLIKPDGTLEKTYLVVEHPFFQ